MFGSRWTCDGKNSSEFERAAAMMHGSSPWILGEEDGLSAALSAVARGNGATDVARRQGVAVATT
jgi:hypothetical protein